MGERVSDELQVDAPLARVWAIITDVASYPAWVDGVLETEVLASDEEGRPAEARFRVDARVAEVTYTLRYHYGRDEVGWTLVEGETISQLDGSYRLEEPAPGQTHVTYALEVDVDVPVPGFLKKRVARTVLDQGLVGLKQRAEEAG